MSMTSVVVSRTSRIGSTNVALNSCSLRSFVFINSSSFLAAQSPPDARAFVFAARAELTRAWPIAVRAGIIPPSEDLAQRSYPVDFISRDPPRHHHFPALAGICGHEHGNCF